MENFPQQRLDLIEWKPADDNNVNILNETIDLYRYFNATKQAEFLYKCVQETIEHTIPDEVAYPAKYDLMKQYLDNYFETPDKTVALLVRFPEQWQGKLSVRAKEFQALNEDEIAAIEDKFREVFIEIGNT